VTIFHLMNCPVQPCKFHHRIIKGPLSLLKNHIFRDHDYIEKLKTAVSFGLIQSIQEKRSPLWLAEQLALEGIR